MYPNLYYAIKDLFGIEIPFLKVLNMFGFLVALSFIAAAYVLTQQLKQKEKQGLLGYTIKEEKVGVPASINELLMQGIVGFLMGFKLLGVFAVPNALDNTQEFMFSSQGSWLFGFLLAATFVGLKWWEKRKFSASTIQTKQIQVWPHEQVGDMLVLAAIYGFLGAKIFNAFETWEDFTRDPLGSLLSFSGLTFYGGLIVAAIAIIRFAKKQHIPIIHLVDAFAPTMMVAYGLGRLGCQLSGDGDWGILNTAYVSDQTGHLMQSTFEHSAAVLKANALFYGHRFGNLDAIQHLHIPAPSGLPQWLFAYNYPHNVVNEGVNMAGCSGNYCAALPIAVFPTPLYECIACLALFAVLLALAKKIKTPGVVFAIYLIFNGTERFLIERIRVNSTYKLGFWNPTQAEIIALLLIITGIVLWYYVAKRKASTPLNNS